MRAGSNWFWFIVCFFSVMPQNNKNKTIPHPSEKPIKKFKCLTAIVLLYINYMMLHTRLACSSSLFSCVKPNHHLLLCVLLPECDQTFVSRAGGPMNGTFTAPNILNPTNSSRQCLYIFLAGKSLSTAEVTAAIVFSVSHNGTHNTIIITQVQDNEWMSLLNPLVFEDCGQSKRTSDNIIESHELNFLHCLSFFSGAAVGELPG